MKKLLILLTILGCSTAAYAATPTISGVSGSVQTGQTLTITGSNMVQENRTNWIPFFQNNTNASSFEGSNPAADGYSAVGSKGGVYDTSVKLLGSKSMKFNRTGAFPAGPGNGGDYNVIATGGGDAQDLWVRTYVRWNLNGGSWPIGHIKMLDCQGGGYQYYFQPTAGTPNGMDAVYPEGGSNANHAVPVPDGPIKYNRWYAMEVHWKTTSPYLFEAWIDGTKVYSASPGYAGSLTYILLGLINLGGTTSDFNLDHWWDGFAVSKSRVYPASIIQISNSPTYGQGTVKYQEPIYLGDGTVQAKADLSGLGSGPYYLWVTNNRQERSAAYNLTTGSGGSTSPSPTPTQDTTKPAVSINSPTTGTISGTVTVSAQASDNVGVAGVQFQLNGANLGSEDTSAPYSLNWDTTTYQNGTYTLTAVARDAAGNTTTSSAVEVTVNNGSTSGTVLFEENFEDSNFSGRGWYDNTALTLSNTEHISGSTKSAAFTFTAGGTKPTSGGSIRKQFPETDSVYVSYWIKYSSNWQEQAGGIGHHEILLLTNQNDAWSNLAFTRLTAYLENWGTSGQLVKLTPHVSFQDGQNIDQSKINVNLTQTTEYRAANGCNGSLDPYQTTCYNSGNGTYWNGKFLSGGNQSIALGQWHHVEAYIKLNSIVNGKGVADGTVAYWLNGQQIFQQNNVLIRTGQFPNMKFNQFVIAPWMGNGAPSDQSFWIDDLKVATSRSSDIPTTPPSAPTNLRVVSAQ